jgi:hypothetical protein
VRVLKDFYALRFDFGIKFFNECILFKDCCKAVKHLKKLNRYVIELGGSDYEVRYRAALVVAEQLLNILKQDLAKQSFQNESSVLHAYWAETRI